MKKNLILFNFLLFLPFSYIYSEQFELSDYQNELLDGLPADQRENIVQKMTQSNQLNKDLEVLGKDSFKFEILRWCDSKWELSYHETKLQFEEEVLLRDDYYNGIINVRIGRRK